MAKTKRSTITTTDNNNYNNNNLEIPQPQSTQTVAISKQVRISINKYLDDSQQATDNHKKSIENIIKLIQNQKDNEKSIKSIYDYLIDQIKKALVSPTRVVSHHIDNFFKFITKFSIQYYKFQKQKLGDQLDNNNEDNSTNTKILYRSWLYILIENLFQFSISNEISIRYRSLQLFNTLLNHKDTSSILKKEILKEIYKKFKTRLNDKSIGVRCTTVELLLKISKIYKNEEITQIVLKLLEKEESPEVRKSIINRITINSTTLPKIVDRIRDKSETVRKVTFQVLSSLDPSKFTKIDLETLINNGIDNRDPIIRNEFTKIINENWFIKYFEKDFIKLIKLFTKVSNEESGGSSGSSDIQQILTSAEPIIQRVLFNLFSNGNHPNDINEFKNLIILKKPMSDEFVLLYKIYFQYLSSKEEDYQDSLLPTPFQLLYYLKLLSNDTNKNNISGKIQSSGTSSNSDESIILLGSGNTSSGIVNSVFEDNNNNNQAEIYKEIFKLEDQQYIFEQLVLIFTHYSSDIKVALFKSHKIEDYFQSIIQSMDYSVGIKLNLITLLRESLNTKYYYQIMLNCISKIKHPIDKEEIDENNNNINNNNSGTVIDDGANEENADNIKRELHSLSIISNILENTKKTTKDPDIYGLFDYIKESFKSKNIEIKEKGYRCFGYYCLLEHDEKIYEKTVFNALKLENDTVRSMVLAFCFDLISTNYQFLDIENSNPKGISFSERFSRFIIKTSKELINFDLNNQLFKFIFIQGISKLFFYGIINSEQIFNYLSIFYFKKDQISNNSYQVLSLFFQKFPFLSKDNMNLFIGSFQSTLNHYLFESNTIDKKKVEIIVKFYLSLLEPNQKQLGIFLNQLFLHFLRIILIYSNIYSGSSLITLLPLFADIISIEDLESIKIIRALIELLEEVEMNKQSQKVVSQFKQELEEVVNSNEDYRDLSSDQVEAIRLEIEQESKERQNVETLSSDGNIDDASSNASDVDDQTMIEYDVNSENEEEDQDDEKEEQEEDDGDNDVDENNQQSVEQLIENISEEQKQQLFQFIDKEKEIKNKGIIEKEREREKEKEVDIKSPSSLVSFSSTSNNVNSDVGRLNDSQDDQEEDQDDEKDSQNGDDSQDTKKSKCIVM